MTQLRDAIENEIAKYDETFGPTEAAIADSILAYMAAHRDETLQALGGEKLTNRANRVWRNGVCRVNVHDAQRNCDTPSDGGDACMSVWVFGEPS